MVDSPLSPSNPGCRRKLAFPSSHVKTEKEKMTVPTLTQPKRKRKLIKPVSFLAIVKYVAIVQTCNCYTRMKKNAARNLALPFYGMLLVPVMNILIKLIMEYRRFY